MFGAGAIFQYRNPGLICQLHDGVHFTRITKEVGHQNGLSAFRFCRFNRGGSEIERMGVDVGKNWNRALCQNWSERPHVCNGGGDDLISRLQIQGRDSNVDCRCTGSAGKCVRHAQLLNVLRGEMTLVGPRPPIPHEVHSYEEWQKARLRVVGGLTCIWQVNGRLENVSFRDWMRQDIRYGSKFSPARDMGLIAKTAWVVLFSRGDH